MADADGSSPLRVTHVLTNGEFAGTERYVVEVSGVLIRRGHEVAVVGGQPGAMTRLLHPDVSWRPGADAPAAVQALIRGGRRDITHSHTAKSDFVATMAAPAVGGARVSTRHITATRGYTRKAQRLARLVRRALSCELAVSRWTSDLLEAPADVVLLNGVRSQPDVTTPREQTVLLAQRLAPEKDTATAIRAWARSGLGDTGWRLVVAGAGNEQPELELLSHDLGVAGSVEFAGWLRDPTEHYRASGIFLAPAPTEPCGLSILEAMSHGLPVVAAASGGHLETVGSLPAAALFPPGDDEAAAAHLVRLAADHELREEYGVALRELQRSNFDIDGHVTRLEAIYRGCLRGARM